jgi:hypothetical protein
MSDAIRARLGGVLVATIVLAGATLAARHQDGLEPLARSLEADPPEWNIHTTSCGGTLHREDAIETNACFDDIWRNERVCMEAGDLIGAWSGDCVNQADDDHCFREEFRAQLEAWEAGKSYEEIRNVSPTGVAFVRATSVRRPLVGTVY